MENIQDAEVSSILKKKQLFINTFTLQDIQYRKDALIKIKSAIIKYEKEILDALNKDLHKNSFELYAMEVGYALSSY